MANAQEEIEEDTVIKNQVLEYSEKAYAYHRININLDSAEYYYNKALDLAYSSSSYKINRRVALNHSNLASLYRTIFNNNEALWHLNEAEKILIQTEPDHWLFGTIYHNKGNIFKVQEDLYRTKEYYEYALDFYITHGYEYRYDFVFVYSNYIALLLDLKEFELAEQKLYTVDTERRLSRLNIDPLNKRLLLFRIHTTNGDLYSEMGKYEEAKIQFELAQNDLRIQPALKEYNSEILNYYYRIIAFHMLYEEYDLALKECDNALLYIESLPPNANTTKIIYRSDIALRSANVHYQQGNLVKALWIVDRSISELKEFTRDLYADDPDNLRTNNLSTALPDLYVQRSRILADQYYQSNEFEDLVAAYEAYQNSIETLNFMKLAMSDENSKVFATSQILEVYSEAVNVAKLLYDLTGESQYLEQSFSFAETSKSFALYSEIKDMEAMQFSDLPDEIKRKENRFVGEIQAYEEFLYEEQIKPDPDSASIESFKEILFHLKDDYSDLKREIEQNYSNYYELKYNPKFVTLEEVQDKLAYKEALIEYVLSDSLLITYVVDRKGINVFTQEIGPEFAGECLEYYMLLNNQNFSGGVHDNYSRYVSLGHKFYNILIEPCLSYTDKKSFTIVPDGAITYIPFEGLITKVTDPEYVNYMDLPYMIRDYSIGYSHSSTLLFSERYQSKSPENKVLAFAPQYLNPLDRIDTLQYRQFDEDTEFLFPLVGTIKEVQSINETVPSKVYINERATEANFKKNASDYRVLHLAMHTIMRDDNPLYSLLAFTNVSEDSVEDNRLYAYEIYNLKLNAQMAVLSACSSGFGEMKKGEGMMSLARGFIYAGCPSIVMTLWQVADKSSSDLMTSFYKYLKRGKSKQEAMRLAKIDYLKKADDLTSNPYFWSGFVVLGDGSPIYNKTGFAYWGIVILIFAGALIYIQYKRS